jgi:hypothetical protein
MNRFRQNQGGWALMTQAGAIPAAVRRIDQTPPTPDGWRHALSSIAARAYACERPIIEFK